MFSSEYQDLMHLLQSREPFHPSRFHRKLQCLIDSPHFVRQFKASHPSHDIPKFNQVYVETPFITSDETYETDVNFDFDLTILVGTIYLYPFRPAFSTYSTIDELHEFVSQHNERHVLSTDSHDSYILTLSGEILYFPKQLLAPFADSSDIFDATPPSSTYFGIRPISTKNLEHLRQQSFFPQLRIQSIPLLPRLNL